MRHLYVIVYHGIWSKDTFTSVTDDEDAMIDWVLGLEHDLFENISVHDHYVAT